MSSLISRTSFLGKGMAYEGDHHIYRKLSSYIPIDGTGTAITGDRRCINCTEVERV